MTNEQEIDVVFKRIKTPDKPVKITIRSETMNACWCYLEVVLTKQELDKLPEVKNNAKVICSSFACHDFDTVDLVINDRVFNKFLSDKPLYIEAWTNWAGVRLSDDWNIDSRDDISTNHVLASKSEVKEGLHKMILKAMDLGDENPSQYKKLSNGLKQFISASKLDAKDLNEIRFKLPYHDHSYDMPDYKDKSIIPQRKDDSSVSPSLEGEPSND